MALSNDDICLAAQRLHRAEQSRQQIRQLSLDHPGITIEDAYAIQKAWIAIKLAEGRIVKGHKSGLTSKAMQSALGIDEPDSGVLLDDMFFDSPDREPQRRTNSSRLWCLWNGELLLRLMRPEKSLGVPTCRISPSNIPPI